jgi:hypothetical protein
MFGMTQTVDFRKMVDLIEDDPQFAGCSFHQKKRAMHDVHLTVVLYPLC